MALIHGLRARGRWSAERGDNLLDTGCPYYDVYTCADGRWVAVGAIEERFFRTCSTSWGWARTRRSPAATRTGPAGRRSGRR